MAVTLIEEGSLQGWNFISTKEDVFEEIDKLEADLDLMMKGAKDCSESSVKYYWNLAVQRWNKWVDYGWTSVKTPIKEAGAEMDKLGAQADKLIADCKKNQSAADSLPSQKPEDNAIPPGYELDCGAFGWKKATSSGCDLVKIEGKPSAVSPGSNPSGVAPSGGGTKKSTSMLAWRPSKKQIIGGSLVLGGLTLGVLMLKDHLSGE